MHLNLKSGSEGSRTLILESTGDAWTIVPSPHPSVARSSLLRDVACAGTTRCIAVGSYEVEGYVSKTLIEENTGSGWAVVPNPNPTDSTPAPLTESRASAPRTASPSGDTKLAMGLERP